MGAWGNGIQDNDTTADIVETFEEFLKAGMSLRKASEQTLEHPDWADVMDDPDQAALIWLGVASVQWKYGELAAATLRRVKADFAAGNGLSNWTEPAKRRRAVEQFIGKISVPNKSPKPLPKPATRKKRFKPAGYEPGDCLAIKLHDGRFSAAYVVDARSPDDAHGSNVVVALDYLAKRSPTLDDFPALQPLKLTHGAWGGQLHVMVFPPRNAESDSLATVVGNRALKHRGYKVERVGDDWINWRKRVDPIWRQVLKKSGKPVRKDDPSLHSMPYGDWDLGGQVLMQEAHDRAQRRKRQ